MLGRSGLGDDFCHFKRLMEQELLKETILCITCHVLSIMELNTRTSNVNGCLVIDVLWTIPGALGVRRNGTPRHRAQGTQELRDDATVPCLDYNV